MAMGQTAKQQRVSKVVSLMAPLGGINDIDPIASMDAQYCLQLNDIFPGNTTLSTRRGYKQWATGLSGAVRTMMNMSLHDGTFKLFSLTNAGIYDVTLSSGSPTLVHALTSGSVNYIQFSNVAGQYLIGCNGVDAAFLYDGLTFIPFSQVASPVNPGEISGVDPHSLSFVTNFKRRLWFIQKDSMTAWYLDTDAVGGVATPFYLGGNFHRGGSLLEIATWSFDAGDGLDDKIVFRTTAGEIAIYAGNNPNNADDWAEESLFFVSPPVGTSAASTDLGGDVLMLCRAGLVPISKIVQGAANSALYENSISKNISRTLNALVQSPYFQSNWQIYNAPTLQAIFIVIPATANTAAAQYVMNTLTGAWCKYSLPVTCMVTSDRNIYFGGPTGIVYQFGTVDLDNVLLDGSGGSPVQSSLFSAYNYFGDPTTNKHFKLIRPIFQSAKKVSFISRLNMDYDLSALPGAPYPPVNSGIQYLWDSAVWDNAFWSSSVAIFRPWTGVVGIGFCAALLMKISSDAEVLFSACEFVYEPGGAI